MLKYKVRLGLDNFKKEELEWREKYLSKDLSLVSGVTSPSYHLEKFPTLAATNSIVNSDATVYVEAENVIREGFIVVKGKVYETNSGETIDYSLEDEGETIKYHYVENKDKYFYWGKFLDSERDDSGYTFNNLLNYSANTENPEEYIISENLEYPCSEDMEKLYIDTVYWIEDGTVTIDGNTYFYDRDEGENGILKYGINGNELAFSSITECDTIEFHPYDLYDDYEEVTRFKLTKSDEIPQDFLSVSFVKYFYYVKYKDNYCQVKRKIDGDDYSFVCEIPKYVLSGGAEEYNLEPIEKELYFINDGDDTYELRKTSYDNGDKLDSAHYDDHGVKTLDELSNVSSFIYIEEDKAFFNVEHDILNANDGNKIGVYLKEDYTPLKRGEKIKFIGNLTDYTQSMVYDSVDYSGKEEKYVFYDGRKYMVKPNICDKVIINENEYSIEYHNGKKVGKDCLVLIGDEKVPMKINGEDDGDFSSGTLARYGKIVSGTSKEAVDAIYSIKPYSGITINGRDHIIYDESTEEEKMIYASIDLPVKYVFTIEEIMGSSLYVCSLDVNDTNFTDDFNRYISEIVCKDIVDEQSDYVLYIKNKIFGENEIKKDSPFLRVKTPLSSDDYYDLFNDLVIYVKNGYINIPLLFKEDIGMNHLQEDLLKNDFYEVEKNKAINTIVDMEKDIYLPKYILGYRDDMDKLVESDQYHGSKTVFKSIYEINLNLHFRTRNLESWKINNGNSLYDTESDLDNWFITDFHPYCDILKDDSLRAVSGDTLMTASDLMGLLYFTDDDVFYQRSKIAKSFVRLSFYDNTDPNTQSLLATSCVFLDEHALFKKFIDNSKKHEREYGAVLPPRWKEEDGFVITPKIDLADEDIYKDTKIHVNTEYLDWASERTPYSSYTEDYMNANVAAEEHRISSRLVIDNKYLTDTSSEGYYIYIFREYAENLRPKPIYMKVEFNHAGIGKTIPFLIPMHWTGNTTDASGEKYNKMYPEHSLQLKNQNDLNELKKGFPLSYTYAQTYIPLYAVYDFENKEYGYVFDSRYVKQDENGILNLNLFEMKIMDESENQVTDRELEDIMKHRALKAIINVNEEQFDKKHFNYETE